MGYDLKRAMSKRGTATSYSYSLSDITSGQSE